MAVDSFLRELLEPPCHQPINTHGSTHLELLYFEVVIERSAIASQRVSGAIDPILVLLLCNCHGYFIIADAGRHIKVDATFMGFPCCVDFREVCALRRVADESHTEIFKF